MTLSPRKHRISETRFRENPADRQGAPAREPQDRRADWRNGIHDDIYYEAQVAVQDPKLIRMEQRAKAHMFNLHGVELAPIERTIDIGRKRAAYRAEITARAFEASKRRLRENR